jgi:aminoglycoside phosphotransferase (APT) family kinase protein
VGRALKAVVPEFRGGRWALKACDVGHIRYQSDFWTALVQLTARKPGEGQDVVIPLQARIFPPGQLTGAARVEGSLGQAGWLARLPELNLELRAREAETVLAALELLTDPEAARQFLESSIRADSPNYRDLRIQSCTPKVVRYKPGSRCTVLYQLAYDPHERQSNHWPELVVAKTYRGEKGKNAYESMAALWSSPLGQASNRVAEGDKVAESDFAAVKIAEPLAYRADVKVLVQGPVREEQTLKNLLFQAVQSRSPEPMAVVKRYLRKTAQGLAALHNSGVTMGQDWDWEDEMAALQRQVDGLAAVLPDLGAAAVPLLNRLNRLAVETPPDPRVPSHGSFRPAQVLLYQGEIGFIDFDSFCQSEPANDLALFLASMFNIGFTPADDEDAEAFAGAEAPANAAGSALVRQPLEAAARQERFDRLMEMHNEFLEEYQRAHPVTYRRVVLWEAIDIFMSVQYGWVKIKVGELEDIIYLLERFLVASGIALSPGTGSEG